MYSNDAYRVLCRRGHRLLGLYLSLWAWIHRVDCVVISGDDLRLFLDVTNVKSERLKWLKNDISIYFRHMRNLIYPGGTHATLYLSRKAFPEKAFEKSMQDEDRIKGLKSNKFRSAMVKLPSEKEMFSMINNFAAGLDVPQVDKKALVKAN